MQLQFSSLRRNGKAVGCIPECLSLQPQHSTMHPQSSCIFAAYPLYFHSSYTRQQLPRHTLHNCAHLYALYLWHEHSSYPGHQPSTHMTACFLTRSRILRSCAHLYAPYPWHEHSSCPGQQFATHTLRSCALLYPLYCWHTPTTRPYPWHPPRQPRQHL
jgi:hypothetical protein